MIKFYLNRELSQRLNINLARWKRWSREFLPPDPLGGLQSGYARQYNLEEAFWVYLGGYLVSGLKFSIPETKMILNDLKDWISSHCIFNESNNVGREGDTADFRGKTVTIHIFWNDADGHNQSKFVYIIRAILSDDFDGEEDSGIRAQRYIEKRVGFATPDSDSHQETGALSWVQSRPLYITDVYDQFLGKLNIGHFFTKPA
jgi:hypothetical protein